MPTPEQLEEVQGRYDEMLRRGLLEKNPDLQSLGHELRARGLVKDPTQGGLQPQPPPMGRIQSPQAAQEWGNFVQEHGMGDPAAPGYAPPGTRPQGDTALKLVPHTAPSGAAPLTTAPYTPGAPSTAPVQPAPTAARQAQQRGVPLRQYGAPTPPPFAPLQEEREWQVAEKHRASLPPPLRNAEYRMGEAGPATEQALQHAWALSRYHGAAPRVAEALAQERKTIQSLGTRLEQLTRLGKAKGVSPQDVQLHNEIVDQIQHRMAAYTARAATFAHADAEWQRMARTPPRLSQEEKYRGFLLPNTTRYLDEVAKDPEHVMSFGPLESIVPGAATRAAMRQMPFVRAQLFLQGKAPQPLINPGRTPQERQQYTQQLADLRGKMERLARAEQPGGVPASYHQRVENDLKATLTPWQRSVYDKVHKHLAFEMLAAKEAGVPQAFWSELASYWMIDLLAPELAPAAQKLVGAPLKKLLGRALAQAGLEEGLTNFAGRQARNIAIPALRRFTFEKLPTAATHAATLGPAGATAAAATTFAQNIPHDVRAIQAARKAKKPPPLQEIGAQAGQAAQVGLQTLPEMTVFGGVMGILHTEMPSHPATTPAAEVPPEIVVHGQPLPLRTTPVEETVQQHQALVQKNAAGQGTHADRVAEETLAAHLGRHQKYIERQQLDLEAGGKDAQQYVKSWQRGPFRTIHDHFTEQAERAREINPELARKLDAAALQASRDFQHTWRVQQERRGRPQRMTSEGGPAQASIWRQLTPEERAALPIETRKNLIAQDISNSQQVLEPGRMPEARPSNYSRTPIKALETQANDLYARAEGAHHQEITATAHEAVGPEPVPAPPPAATFIRGELQPVAPRAEPVVEQPAAKPAEVTPPELRFYTNQTAAQAIGEPLWGRLAPTYRARLLSKLNRLHEIAQREGAEGIQRAGAERQQALIDATIDYASTKPNTPARKAARAALEHVFAEDAATIKNAPAAHEIAGHLEQLQETKPEAHAAITQAVREELNAAGIPPEEVTPEIVHDILQHTSLSFDTPEGTTHHVTGVEHGTAAGSELGTGAGERAPDAAVVSGTSPGKAPERGAAAGVPAEPGGATELGAPAAEPGAVVARRASRGGKAGQQPQLEGRGGTGSETAPAKAQEAPGGYRPGVVLEKSDTGLRLELKEPGSKPGTWQAVVRAPGEATRWVRGQVVGPVYEKTLNEFKRVMKDEEGAFRAGFKEPYHKEYLKELEKSIKEGYFPEFPTKYDYQNYERLREAKTGQPIELIGMRAEKPGKRIPNTGTFYASHLEGALNYTWGRGIKTGIKRTLPGIKGTGTGPFENVELAPRQIPALHGITIDRIKFDNPLVIRGGHQKLADAVADRELPFSESERQAVIKAWTTPGINKYVLLDKAIAQAAKRAGYDGIIYRKHPYFESDNSFVDLSDVRLTGFGAKAKQLLQNEEGAINLQQIKQRFQKQPTPTKEIQDHNPKEFFNPDEEVTYQRNKTEAPPPTPWQQVTQSVAENVKGIANGFARAETHIPANARQYDVVRMYLDYRKNSVPMSQLKSELQLGRAINGFTPDELDLFSKAWFALGAKEDIENQYSKHIEDGKDPAKFTPVPPDGFTAAGVDKAFDKAVELMKGSGRVAQSLAKMHDLNSEVWDGYRQSYERTTGRKMSSDIFFYMRHLILDYDDHGNYIGPGKVTAKRPGFTLQRRWSSLAYSTDLIKATMEWMPKAIREKINLDLLHHADVEHNIAPGIAFGRIKQQAPAAHIYLSQMAKSPGEELVHMPDAVQQLGELAAKNFLPDTMGQRFRPVIDALHFHWQMNAERALAGEEALPLSMTTNRALKPYATWLLEQENKRIPLKGHEIPEGYRAYSYENLRRVFRAFSIPDHLGEEAMLQATGNLLGVPVEKVRTVLAVGRDRQPMIIPEALAKTFDEMGLQRPDNLDNRLARIGRGLMQAFKFNAIFTPFRTVHQILKTLVLHGGPILRKIPSALAPGNLAEATQQVYDVGVRKIAPIDPDMKAWVDRGGMGSTQYQFEGVRVGDLGQFARPARNPLTQAGHTYISLLRLPHDWRERAFRLSVFKETMKQMRADPYGMPKDFLASNMQEIRNLPTIEDRAWRLTEDINIPYRRTSEMGRWIGQQLAPFWSVQEHLFRREVQFARNAWEHPAMSYDLGRKLTGNSVGMSRAVDIGKFALRLGAVSGVWAFGNKLTPAGRQAEDRMSLRDRYTPHITLSYDPKTDIAVTAPIYSNLFEAARWFGVDHWPEYWDDYITGRKTPAEIAQDMALDPVNEFYKTMGPQWKIPIEWVPGLKRFPDFRHPVPMHDRWEEAFRMVALDGVYRSIYNIKQRPATTPERMRDFFLSTRYIDLGESAYNETRQAVDRFLQSKGISQRGVTLGDDPRSLLLYRFRQALRVGDTTSAFQYLVKGAFDKRIGLTGDNYIQSVKNMEPLKALNPENQPQMLDEFLRRLPADDRAKLEQAYYHWQKLYAPNADLSQLDVSDTANLIRTMRVAVMQGAYSDNALQKLQSSPATAEKIQDVQREKALLKR